MKIEWKATARQFPSRCRFQISCGRQWPRESRDRFQALHSIGVTKPLGFSSRLNSWAFGGNLSLGDNWEDRTNRTVAWFYADRTWNPMLWLNIQRKQKLCEQHKTSSYVKILFWWFTFGGTCACVYRGAKLKPPPPPSPNTNKTGIFCD